MSAKIEHFSEALDGVMLTVEAGNGKRSTVVKSTVNEAIIGVLDDVADYDSKADTLEHILKVNQFLGYFVRELIHRGHLHDQSKLGPEEKPHFDRVSKKLSKLTYGSDKYNESLKDLQTALKHHYENNNHHPEHYKHGVAGMNLIDLVEMFCDWTASSQRTKGGKLDLETSFERFKFDPQLANIFRNTATYLNIPVKEE